MFKLIQRHPRLRWALIILAIMAQAVVVWIIWQCWSKDKSDTSRQSTPQTVHQVEPKSEPPKPQGSTQPRRPAPAPVHKYTPEQIRERPELSPDPIEQHPVEEPVSKIKARHRPLNYPYGPDVKQFKDRKVISKRIQN
jgi:hypothetical protein